MSLNNTFSLMVKLIPSRNTITHTAEPSAAFIICISLSVIPSKDVSIDRCNAKIDTNASAKDIFRSVMRVADVLCRNLTRLIVARVIFVNA